MLTWRIAVGAAYCDPSFVLMNRRRVFLCSAALVSTAPQTWCGAGGHSFHETMVFILVESASQNWRAWIGSTMIQNGIAGVAFADGGKETTPWPCAIQKNLEIAYVR